MIGWRDYQSYFFTSGFVIVNWKAIYYSKKGNSKQRQQNYLSQHPIEQLALSPVSHFTEMKIPSLCKRCLLTTPQRDMRGLLESVLTSEVSQGFRGEVMTLQKDKTLPFVGYFLLLSKKSWKPALFIWTRWISP